MNNTPKTLTVTECHQLLDALLCRAGPEVKFRKGIRNYCMACLMLEAGLRVGEVVKLRVADVIFNCCPVTSIIVSADIAKNSAERIIPVSTRLADALKEMVRYYWMAILKTCEAYAFGGKNYQKHVTTRQVERIIRVAAIRSIGRPVHPHILRHTFASRLLRKTDIRTVQELLGHKSVTSTQIYTHPSMDDMKKAIKELDASSEEETPRHNLVLLSRDFTNNANAPAADGDM